MPLLSTHAVSQAHTRARTVADVWEGAQHAGIDCGAHRPPDAEEARHHALGKQHGRAFEKDDAEHDGEDGGAHWASDWEAWDSIWEPWKSIWEPFESIWFRASGPGAKGRKTKQKTPRTSENEPPKT